MFKRWMIVVLTLVGLALVITLWAGNSFNNSDIDYQEQVTKCEKLFQPDAKSNCIKSKAGHLELIREEKQVSLEFALIALMNTLLLLLASGVGRWIWKGKDK